MLRRYDPIKGDWWCGECGLTKAEEFYDKDTGYRDIRCSCCGEEDIEEAEHCRGCGKAISPYEIGNWLGGVPLCEDCRKAEDDIITNAIKDLQSDWIDAEMAKDMIMERIEA